MRINMMELVYDARGKAYTPTPPEIDPETGKPKEGAKPEPVRVRDLFHQAMQDEGPPGPGLPPPTVTDEDRRKRWRIAVKAFAIPADENGEAWWEDFTPQDRDYVLERANVMCISATFGFLDDVFVRAVQADTPPPRPGEPPAPAGGDEEEPSDDG